MPSDPSEQTGPEPAALSRRTVLRGVAVLGGAGLTGGLGGCGGGSGSPPAPAGPSAAAASSSAVTNSLPPESAAASSSAEASSAENSAAAGGQETLVAAARVPRGGGVVLAEQKVVVTQPSAGEFKAFSAICTHQNCPVTEVTKEAIVCRCHGSRFSIEDGSVTNPPARKALPAVAVKVQDGNVVRG